MPRISTGAVHGGKSYTGILTMTPMKRSELAEKANYDFSKANHLAFALITAYPNFSVGSDSPQEGNIQTICKNMTTTEKIVQSYLDYISTPNVHSECFIFTSVALHINVWYSKIWWANYAMLLIFILHSHFFKSFWNFMFLSQLKKNSLTGKMQV